jgi:hypothetical protein
MSLLLLLALGVGVPPAPALAALAVDAPVTAVTVYSDRARVTRAATLDLEGRRRVQLPLLPDSVDPATIRLEAEGAEIERVEISRISSEQYPHDQAQKLLSALEAMDDRIALASRQRAAYAAPLDLLGRLAPAVPSAEPPRPTPKLDASGWATALTFARTWRTRLDGHLRELDHQLVALARKREALVSETRLLGASARRSGHRITAVVNGRGAAKLRLSYLAQAAHWYPRYDIALAPATGQVLVQLAGAVSQESGEDWVDAQLTLSTAEPATATQFPRLLTWKIGERERFIPTPVAMRAEPPTAAAPAEKPATADLPPADDLLARLRTRAAVSAAGDANTEGKEVGGEADGRYGQHDSTGAYGPPAAPAPPPARPIPNSEYDSAKTRVLSQATETVARSPGAFRLSSETYSRRSEPTESVGLLPPAGYLAPRFSPDLPVSLAGGWDLVFAALGRETVRSGQGARRVALAAYNWPVRVERKLVPALSPYAYLVAELKNPSSQALPGGRANLFVGADPAGEASLQMVAPGESFTLPLGIDRALRPLRNVKLLTSEKGIFSKDEVNEYQVTIELANPYRAPVAVRIIDQLPTTSAKDVEIKLLGTQPAVAARDSVKGTLEWRLEVPAGGTTSVSFRYSIKRPKGWRLHQ